MTAARRQKVPATTAGKVWSCATLEKRRYDCERFDPHGSRQVPQQPPAARRAQTLGCGEIRRWRCDSGFALDRTDPGGRRPLPQPLAQLRHGRLAAAGQHLDAAVREIPGMAGHTQPARMPLGRGAKEHALDPATDTAAKTHHHGSGAVNRVPVRPSKTPWRRYRARRQARRGRPRFPRACPR